jgi:hypothetical protein
VAGRAIDRLALVDAGDDEDSQRPLSIQGSGTAIAHVWAAAAIFAVIGRTTLALRAGPPPWWMLPLVVAAVPTVPIGAIALLERWRGDPWKSVIDRVMLQSRSWPFWWPRRWRRAGDVWDRLPATIKRVRGMIAGAVPLLMLEVITFAIIWDRWAHEVIPPAWISGLAVGGVVAGYGLFMGGILYARGWAKRRGLTGNDGARVALAPTGNLAFWRKPRYAALLEAPERSGGAPRAAEPQVPQGYVRAIAEAAAQLSGPVRETGSEAVMSARQLAGSIEALDAEIVQLARDANPAELAQVEHKLAALGDAAADHDARGRMRALLEGQRDLLRGLTGQLAASTQRRSQLADLLKTLWLQVASLRAEAAREALGAGEVTGRIRALCEEISHHAHAAAEVRGIAPGTGG